jgi:hypothetical protein
VLIKEEDEPIWQYEASVRDLIKKKLELAIILANSYYAIANFKGITPVYFYFVWKIWVLLRVQVLF